MGGELPFVSRFVKFKHMADNISSLLSPTDIEVIERVLNMRTGYVMDFSDRTFDNFIAHEIGVDATAPRFTVDGASKAKRLRRIFSTLSAEPLAKLLKSFLKYRDSPARDGSVDLLDDEWRQAYKSIFESLELSVAQTDRDFEEKKTYAASAWTGRRTLREQVAIVRDVAPMALTELNTLATLIEERRFNDPITADAVACLRELHGQIGELLSAIDRGQLTRSAVEAIEKNRKILISLVSDGAKLTVVAPAMTFGIMHLLAWISGVPIDSTMVSAVYGSVVGADALNSFGKKSSLAED